MEMNAMTSTASEHTSWTAAGSDATAQATYASIKAALEPVESALSLDIYLQGSYANATNIRADSDVDVVAQSDRTFVYNRSRLSAAAIQRWKNAYSPATYQESDLRRDVKSALVQYYGSSRVGDKDKCITVAKRQGYVDADVVPAFQYRYYRSSDPADIRTDWAEGIIIYPLSGGSIVNFPKEHIKNGQTKNQRCANRYKRTVRQMKQLRNRAASEGRLAASDAPGYLLECMTYNVPDAEFVANDSDRLMKVVLGLKHADKSTFMSCDGIHTLFGTDPGNFNIARAQMIIDALWEAY